jgi:hypothetical protein
LHRLFIDGLVAGKGQIPGSADPRAYMRAITSRKDRRGSCGKTKRRSGRLLKSAAAD